MDKLQFECLLDELRRIEELLVIIAKRLLGPATDEDGE